VEYNKNPCLVQPGYEKGWKNLQYGGLAPFLDLSIGDISSAEQVGASSKSP